MKKSVALILVMILLSAISAQAEEIYFRFDHQSRSQLDQLSNIVSIDDIDHGMVYAYANSREFSSFKQMGIPYEILQHPGTLYRPTMTSSTRELREWNTYPTYETYVEIMHEFAEDYPEICRLENIGQTVEGRDLLVVKISDNVEQEEAEPEFFYTGTMHGDETAGYIMLLRLIDYLLENYGTDTQVTEFVDNIEIWINPAANPDGTYHGGNHTVYGAQRYNANNVDLNRNFPDPRSGAHPDGNAWQPENIAMMAFAEEHHFVMSANFHGGTEVVNYPWDTWSRRHPDDEWYQFVSHIYADAAQELSPNDYFDGYDDGITNGYDWYCVDGGRQDYMNYYHHCREVTIEISDTKLLPESDLNDFWTYNKDAMLGYMEQVMYGFGGTVSDINNNPVYAFIEVLSHDADSTQIYSDPVWGNYNRPIEPGTWDVKFSAYGYDDQTINNIHTVNNALVIQDVILQPDDNTIEVTGHILNTQNGDPVTNAVIQIDGLSMANHRTDSDGQFSYFLFAGTYDLQISADGFTDQTTTISVDSESNYFDISMEMKPLLETDINGLDFQLETGENLSQSFVITNSGGSILNYVIQTAEPDSRGIEGSLVSCQATSYTPGESCDWLFTIENNSADGEWIKGVEIEFPTGITVNEANDFIGGSGGAMVFDGNTGEAPTINWVGETSMGYGVLHDGQMATASVNVSLDAALMDDLMLNYTIFGDGYGVDPHTISGTMEISYPFGWIDISPQSGPLAAGESETINVTVDTEGLEPGDYFIDLILTDNDTNNLILPVTLALEISDSYDETIPPSSALISNYPNPFNPETTISFNLAQDDLIDLEIFNIKGEKIRSLANGIYPAGSYSLVWKGLDDAGKPVASGIYFYKLKSKNIDVTRKMLLMK